MIKNNNQRVLDDKGQVVAAVNKNTKNFIKGKSARFWWLR